MSPVLSLCLFCTLTASLFLSVVTPRQVREGTTLFKETLTTPWIPHSASVVSCKKPYLQLHGRHALCLHCCHVAMVTFLVLSPCHTVNILLLVYLFRSEETRNIYHKHFSILVLTLVCTRTGRLQSFKNMLWIWFSPFFSYYDFDHIEEPGSIIQNTLYIWKNI